MNSWHALIVACALALSQAAPTPVTISELIARPKDHYDQRFVVSGILKVGYSGVKLCEVPSRSRDLGWDSCIDVSSRDLPMDRMDWRLRGALVSVTGYFSHTCPDPQVAGEDGVQRMCLHAGWHGFISIESFTVAGFATCADDECAPQDTTGTHEVAASDAQAQGIDGFAKSVVAAARSRHGDRIAALTIPFLRTETSYDLGTRERFDRNYGELANAPPSVTEPRRGFRLFTIEAIRSTPPHHVLCFCVKGDCTSRWSQAPAIDDRLSPFQCRVVLREAGAWYLLY